ncbi:MAG: PilZ domain-containing protein [Kofleriaceae bacterium]|nr:PilZ domain-containing protein [Myxococcales bacterium]MCB9563085.1 PilZ domain-containing protein [Kofleriaceae bacterium]
MSDADQPQQRDAERVKVEAFVKVSGAGDQEFVFRTRDLSASGVFLYTRVAHIYPFKVGSTLQLELYDYDEFVTCKVVVVRVVEPGSAESDRYPTGFGVRIIECDDTSRAHLDAMISRVKDQGELY